MRPAGVSPHREPRFPAGTCRSGSHEITGIPDEHQYRRSIPGILTEPMSGAGSGFYVQHLPDARITYRRPAPVTPIQSKDPT